MYNTTLFLTIICIIFTVSPEVNAQDHENVEQVGRIYNQWDAALDVVVAGGLAYVATGISGLQIVDISSPENPEIIGYWDDNTGNAEGVAVSGDYAYVADDGLYVISVTNPEHPEEVGYLDTLGYACDVTVSGDYAYVADWDSGLRVISVSDPEHPVEVGHYNTPGEARDVALSEDGLIYVADGTNVGIYRFTDPAKVDDSSIPHPSSFILYPAYPNPFNSTTTIRYGLGKPTPTRLALYDLSGREVRTLFEGYRQAGIHVATLTANDLASGLYFVRLEASDQVFTQKVMLIR